MSVHIVSKQTQKNWWIDLTLFSSALMAALSGIYFLFLPSNGYQGGRNPLYNVQFIFDRQTWDDLHTWGGVAMVVVAVIHLVVHWSWVVSMARRSWNEINGRCAWMNWRGRMNLILNTVVAASFLLTAASGVYFLFVPGGRWAADPMLLFTRSTWDLIHTWAGVVLISAAVLHFAIHWKWVTKVTNKMVAVLKPARAAGQPTTPVYSDR
jgi:hypothetical protein